MVLDPTRVRHLRRACLQPPSHSFVRCSPPIVTTLHTGLAQPASDQRALVKQLDELTDRVIHSESGHPERRIVGNQHFYNSLRKR